MNKILILLFISVFLGCSRSVATKTKVRQPVDTIGFAHLAQQMDSIMVRIGRMNKMQDCAKSNSDKKEVFRLAVCPHDDYTYAGFLYAQLLRSVKAPVVILFGVAHKARSMGIENRIVFDSWKQWSGPYGNVSISPLRNKLIEQLDTTIYMISDTLQNVEHSLEAIVPFLQYYNRNVQIVPILVPAMPFERMQEIAANLSRGIMQVTQKQNMQWGKDFALIISTDAVHYGDEDWGGKNYAPFGSDTAGYIMAMRHEQEILDSCLKGPISTEKIQRFFTYTVSPDDFREYIWTWCGRYSVPFGLLVAWNLGRSAGNMPEGRIIGYATSIDHLRLPVEDLGMGTTANASLRHWVGYAAVGFE